MASGVIVNWSKWLVVLIANFPVTSFIDTAITTVCRSCKSFINYMYN